MFHPINGCVVKGLAQRPTGPADQDQVYNLDICLEKKT